jgi:hypothetical protein
VASGDGSSGGRVQPPPTSMLVPVELRLQRCQTLLDPFPVDRVHDPHVEVRLGSIGHDVFLRAAAHHAYVDRDAPFGVAEGL